MFQRNPAGCWSQLTGSASSRGSAKGAKAGFTPRKGVFLLLPVKTARQVLEGPLWLLGRNGLAGQRESGGEPWVADGARGTGRAGTGPRTRQGRRHRVGADRSESGPWPAPHSAPLTCDGDPAPKTQDVREGSPRSPAACPGGTPAQSWWQRSPRRPGSQGACGHHSPPSAQRPPGERHTAWLMAPWPTSSAMSVRDGTGRRDRASPFSSLGSGDTSVKWGEEHPPGGCGVRTGAG